MKNNEKSLKQRAKTLIGVMALVITFTVPQNVIAVQQIQGEVIGESILAEMTLEEKVAQMFFITPEALTEYGKPGTGLCNVKENAGYQRKANEYSYFSGNR